MTGTVYIIAGPNGAGKTTFAREFLPLYASCRNFINADLIAQGLAPFSPESAAVRAGRLMLEEIDRLSRGQDNFGFETTLSGKSHLRLIADLKNSGFRVELFYLWVADVELLLARVRSRVKKGGHDVPPELIRRRFRRSIDNFFRLYRSAVDSWLFFDNSGTAPDLLAYLRLGTAHILKARYSTLASVYEGRK